MDDLAKTRFMETPMPKTDGYFYDKNQWALILGGSSGIGLASAKKLASEGMHLVIVHRDRKQTTKSLMAFVDEMKQKGIQVITFNKDAITPENRQFIITGIQDAISNNGRIKLILHAISRGTVKPLTPRKTLESPPVDGLKTPLEAGYQAIRAEMEALKTKMPNQLSTEDFQVTLNYMALSLYDWVKAIFEADMFAEDARVLGLTSEGNKKAIPFYGAVSVAKNALEGICRQIAAEFAPFGIRCNVLQPGVTETPSLKMIPGHEQLILQAKLRNPFDRLTTPDDVANVVYLMCRPESSWINGAIIPVDGGEKNG